MVMSMQIETRYTNAFSEVYEILQHLDKDEIKKISSNLIETIKNNRNKNYIYTIKPGKKLKEQEMLPETKAILFNIFRDYLCSEEQQIKIKKWQLEDIKKLEEKKKQKYNVDVFFNKSILNPQISKPVTDLVTVEKQNSWKKIINIIKKFFKI